MTTEQPGGTQAPRLPRRSGANHPGSVGQDVLIVGHRVHILTRLVGVWAWRGCRLEAGGWRVAPGTTEMASSQPGDLRLQAGDAYGLRRDRNKPFKTLQVSTLNADNCWCDGSARKPSRKARPTWHSTSRADPYALSKKRR